MTDFMPLDRRSMLERALLLVGATAAASVSPAAFAKAVGRRPALAPATFTLLSTVADTIVPRTHTPGAIDARVPAKLDALLVTWASPEHRVSITGALTTIDEMAKSNGGKGFAALTPERRKELLVAHDIAALKAVPRKEALTGVEALMGKAAVADPGYAKLKELIVILYYYSEEALTTELNYEHSPGGWTPSVKVTPETRADGGLSAF
jgi:gluconate 2-dehydrogenase gamma chain